ncbi:hypothetical protein CMI37_32180 [Candidatus Pacearchaeota archaeon]|nr:hypothetical protein [Candidatus Pacearchaeota archaeon]
MAAPTAPTLTTIATEGIKKSGYGNAASTLLTRAEDEWVEEIKNDIWTLAKKLKSLYTTTFQVTSNGVEKYSYPTDFSSEMTMTLMTGGVTGTAQAGSSSSITLAAGNTSTDLIGKEIMILSGTGSAQINQITAYNSTTKVATVNDTWTDPSSDSVYMVVDKYKELEQTVAWKHDGGRTSPERGEPSHFFPIGDSDNGEFILFPTPFRSATDTNGYGIRHKYYADLTRIDLASTLMTTLYRRWRSLFIQGVKYKSLENLDDNRATQEAQKYRGDLNSMILRETYGMDLSNIEISVLG